MIYVVRHGQTDWNIEHRIQGHQDIPLNDKGVEEANFLKDELSDIDFDLVFSSPLKRAYKTAEIITKKPIRIDDRLIERYNGKLEGCNDLDLIRNSILYANMLPPDYSIVLLKDYLYLEKDYKQKLLQIPEFMKWLREKGRFLDAV